MMRLIVAFVAFSLSSVASAQERISVRAGEHPTYSRLVIQIAPDRPWEFRNSGRTAILTLPDMSAEFVTDDVFRRIPKTRIRALNGSQNGNTTRLEISLACDCDARAQILNDLLFIDVSDASPNTPQQPTDVPAEQARQVDIAPPRRPDAPPVQDSTDPVEMANSVEDIAPNVPSETDPEMTAADVTQRLMSQLNRAAEQGLIELADPPETKMVEAPPPEPILPDTPEQHLQPVEEDIDGLEALADRMERELGADDIGGSISVRIPQELVSPMRPGTRPAATIPEDPEEEDLAAHCIDPDFLDIRDWTDERPAAVQISDLRGRVFGEFDNPDPRTALDLARVYVAHGFGMESSALIRDLNLDGIEAELLHELAKVIEGQPHIPSGLLDTAAGCGGVVAMWRTAAIDRAETLPVPDPDSVVRFFSEMPILVRRLVGPRLIRSLMQRGQVAEANAAFAVIDRSRGPHGDAHELLRARLMHADGQIREAEARYNHLIQIGRFEAVEASALLTESMIARGARIPTSLIEDLEALAYIYRGSEEGRALRISEISAKAGSDRLSDALKVVQQETGNDFSDQQDYAEATNRILSQATLERYGAGPFAEAVFEYMPIVRNTVITDDTRMHVAQLVLEAGLPDTALELAELVERAEQKPRLSARALLAKDNTEAALRLLDAGTEDTDRRLRAQALTKAGRYGDAFEEIQGIASNVEASDFAWRAGAWSTAVTSDRPEVRTFSEFMMVRNAPLEPDLETLASVGITPQSSNILVDLPPTEADISLAYARSVIDRSQQVRGYLGEAMEKF